MSDFTNEWFMWLELEEKWLPKLTDSLKNIEIDGQLQKMSWEEQISYLVPSWIEKVTKLHEKKGIRLDKKGHKSEIAQTSNNHYYEYFEGTSPYEKGHKLKEENRLNSTEKPTKLPNKKIRYIVVILLMLGSSLSIDELMEIFQYNHKGKFRDNHIRPLEIAGFIKKTISDKPTAPNQKYVITEKGKRFLTGRDF